MPITSGQRLAHFEILAKVGEGGMGEVYRAHDTRLRRDVAVKVLPAAVAADEERLRRFEQEAHAAAALNHPNILAVYDVGRADGTAYVVTELLEGQTLRAALATGAPPLRKVLGWAAQIASGLAAAHEKGITHRDLKPENLFVTADDRVKILDFGLAKVTTPTGATSATALAINTEPGMVLGTVGYMAPEQVRGQVVDHRADIFSFGAVLFELLTGRRAFAGDTAADTMMAILKDAPPDVAASGVALPPALARVVDRCLEKSPALRFQSASDLAFALQTLGSGATSPSAVGLLPVDMPAARARRPWALVAATAIAAVILTAVIAWSLRPVPAPLAFLEVDITPPDGLVTGPTSALSPDGTRFAFTAGEPGGRTELWLRTFASGETVPVRGTDEASSPFWSPDGESIGFFAGGRLKVVVVATGRVRVLADAPGARQAGTWNAQDVIVFASEAGVPLKRVDARGGTPPVELPSLGFRPHFLPDGRHFLVWGGPTPMQGGIRVADLENDVVRRLGAGRDAQYADGHLLVVRGGTLVAQPFDATTLTLSGEPVVIADVGSYPGSTGPTYTAAAGMIAVRRNQEPTRHLVWYTRDGTRQGEVTGGTWTNPSFSPDDARVAVERDEALGTGRDIWILDVARGTSRALTGDVGGDEGPTWSSDGERVFFQQIGREGVRPRALVSRSIAGGSTETVTTGINSMFVGLLPDGRAALTFGLADGHRDIRIVPLDGSPAVPFAPSPQNETQPAISPDGRWLAYVSDELGPEARRDVFIEAFPGGGRKVQVTEDTGGGVQPRWRRDGRELFYVSPDGHLVAVAVDGSGDALRLGSPTRLFRVAIGYEPGIGTRANYDATRDGQRFIVSEFQTPRAADSPYTLFVNWRTAVARGVRPAGDPGGG